MDRRHRLLVTGAGGQLGRELVTSLGKTFAVHGTTSRTMDVRDADRVQSVFGNSGAQAVIHCAAMTDVDACENDPDLAMAVNRDGTAHIAEACRQPGALMIYISTDYVFDGEQAAPYRETDHPAPINVYGRSKLAGEQIVRELLPDSHVIVRTAWVYGWHGENFVKTMLRLAREGKEPIRIVSDQIGNPTWTEEIARQIDRIIERDLRGIIHAASGGSCSRFDLAAELFKTMNYAVDLESASSDAFPRPARRPANSSLENARLNDAGVNVMRPWRDALHDFIHRFGDRL
jgi:dTDP-4-dehydrorhamnose reductase